MKIRAVVKPNSRHNEGVLVNQEGIYEIRVKTPAREGRANARAIEILAKHFGKPKSSIELISGAGSRYKTFEIADL